MDDAAAAVAGGVGAVAGGVWCCCRWCLVLLQVVFGAVAGGVGAVAGGVGAVAGGVWWLKFSARFFCSTVCMCFILYFN